MNAARATGAPRISAVDDERARALLVRAFLAYAPRDVGEQITSDAAAALLRRHRSLPAALGSLTKAPWPLVDARESAGVARSDRWGYDVGGAKASLNRAVPPIDPVGTMDGALMQMLRLRSLIPGVEACFAIVAPVALDALTR
jgi:hypothetical protein